MLKYRLQLCGDMLYFQKKCCPNTPLFDIYLKENKIRSTHDKTPNRILFNFLPDISNTLSPKCLSRAKAMIHLYLTALLGKSGRDSLACEVNDFEHTG